MACGSVEKMLTGIKFPQNLRALRMVVEILIRKRIVDNAPGNDMDNILNELRIGSKTSKLWVDCLSVYAE